MALKELVELKAEAINSNIAALSVFFCIYFWPSKFGAKIMPFLYLSFNFTIFFCYQFLSRKPILMQRF